MKKDKKYNTLLIRMDKIGDLVVSLNAAEHPLLKDQDCLWVISRGLGWVLENSPYRKNFIELPKTLSLKNFFKMVSFFRHSGANSAIVFQAPWFVGLALLVAGVSQRIGRLSQWHSYLFYNKGIRQKRSLSEMHESEYNWEMITEGLSSDRNTGELVHPQLSTPTDAEPVGLPQTGYCVVHPGMMGSALNWPVENYIRLVSDLSKSLPIVVTGTTSDRPWTVPLQSELRGQPNIHWLQESLNPHELLHVLSKAKFVIAPSTGIIHLASALQTPVVGFYSPKRPERASRWGPLNDKALIFTPPLDAMNHADCMRLIEPEDVLSKIKREFQL